MRAGEGIFSGRGDNVWEGPEHGDHITYVGSWRWFRLVGLWSLGEVNEGQMTKGLMS